MKDGGTGDNALPKTELSKVWFMAWCSEFLMTASENVIKIGHGNELARPSFESGS